MIVLSVVCYCVSYKTNENFIILVMYPVKFIPLTIQHPLIVRFQSLSLRMPYILKISAALLGGILIFSACKKDKIVGGTPNNPDTMNFTVSGFNNITIQQTDTVILPISVEHVSGGKKNVSLIISVLPQGLNLSYSTQIDTPTYTSNISFIANGVRTGDYPITLTATSSEFVKTYNMTLHVDTVLPNPALALVGTYLETGNCSASGAKNNNASVSIYNVNNNYNEIEIKDFWTTSGNIKVMAVINPASQTLTITPQQNGAVTISGSGTYTANTIELTYNVTDGSIVNDNCTTTLMRLP